MSELTIGSLFSGIGGIEIGFEKQGFTTGWFVEKDLYARTILSKRFPDTEIYEDITELDFGTVPKVDIITGGFPCQDISNAGKRVGIEGSRSSLWKYYRDAIREIRPKFALIENVSALTRRGLNVVLSDLAEIGYDAEWYNLSASAVGALHRRERIFIIAYPNSERFQETRSEQQTPRTARSSEDVENAISDRSDEGDWNTITRGETSTEHSSKSIGASRWATEPDVGRRFDGFSTWLDKINHKFYISHKLLIEYGNETKTRPEEVMQSLWNSFGEETNEWEIRGQKRISSETVLFAYLRQLKKSKIDKTWLQLESKETSEDILRGMWGYEEPPCSPHKSKNKRQSRRKHPNSLQTLSQLLALHAEEAWITYCRENAESSHFEEGISRVANFVSNRVDRIKCLGNAVVPQCAEVFARAIKEYEQGGSR